jgi:DNA-binding MarR family transcriptional regulator
MMKRQLGTQLRHLIELLDGAVSTAYVDAGLDYRPRYTPVFRALMSTGSCTIGQIAESAGITQPAATQTVALMVKQGLVAVAADTEDARLRILHLTAKGSALTPHLQQCWNATSLAAASIDAELPLPLSEILASTIEMLTKKSFYTRINEARIQMLASEDAMATSSTLNDSPPI